MTKKGYPCPFCGKECDTAWQLKNHVRASGGEHGPKFTFPEGFKVDVSNVTGPPSPNVTEPNVTQTLEPNVTKGPQDGDLTNIQKIDPPKTKPVLKCPECGSTKEDWIPIANAEDEGYKVTDEIKKEYDFFCSNCRELIKVRE